MFGINKDKKKEDIKAPEAGATDNPPTDETPSTDETPEDGDEVPPPDDVPEPEVKTPETKKETPAPKDKAKKSEEKVVKNRQKNSSNAGTRKARKILSKAKNVSEVDNKKEYEIILLKSLGKKKRAGAKIVVSGNVAKVLIKKAAAKLA
jgi:hypothetical protein